MSIIHATSRGPHVRRRVDRLRGYALQPSDGFRHARHTVRHVVRGDDLGSKLTNLTRNWVGPIGPETVGPAGVVLVALSLNGAIKGSVADRTGPPLASDDARSRSLSLSLSLSLFSRSILLPRSSKKALGVGQNGGDFW
ncbi:hypothetical protein OPV22_029341 [Ensete ventricosum]|uniref:Uncharacterized protein n=1 Tax=Ensete ventricosum TaxID=4639 RepID=A0AAV8Q6E8_ENSVE|nr:hypothetical protein OPV22_029341 [Ensete ventricosum]